MSDKLYMTRAEGNWKFIMMMLAFFALAVPFQLSQNEQSRILAVQQQVLITQCTAANISATGTNEVLDSLISAVKITKSIPDSEKVTRIARYESVKVPLLKCSPRPV